MQSFAKRYAFLSVFNRTTLYFEKKLMYPTDVPHLGPYEMATLVEIIKIGKREKSTKKHL